MFKAQIWIYAGSVVFSVNLHNSTDPSSVPLYRSRTVPSPPEPHKVAVIRTPAMIKMEKRARKEAERAIKVYIKIATFFASRSIFYNTEQSHKPVFTYQLYYNTEQSHKPGFTYQLFYNIEHSHKPVFTYQLFYNTEQSHKPGFTYQLFYNMEQPQTWF